MAKKIYDFKNSERCPLCLNQTSYLLYISTRKNLERSYYKCKLCFLVFVPKEFHISFERQKKRYLEHKNDINNEDYKSFLLPVVEVLLPKIKIKDKGLDYGAGPGPALAHMLVNQGMDMDVYDIHFFNDSTILNKEYDFITATETIEHFDKPYNDFKNMTSLLKPNGILTIMTSILYDNVDFENWYYRMDPTHVAFYTPGTLEWISFNWNFKIEFPKNNICMFFKSS